MKLAYIQTYLNDKTLNMQIEQLNTLGIQSQFIYIDTANKRSDQLRYYALKDQLKSGDLLYLPTLTYLGKTYSIIQTEWQEITYTIGADIVVLDQSELLDSRNFKNAAGKLLEAHFYAFLKYFAVLEQKKHHRNQLQGIANTISKGRPYGRKKSRITPEFKKAYEAWKCRRITAAEAIRQSGYKRTTFYKYVKEYKNKND